MKSFTQSRLILLCSLLLFLIFSTVAFAQDGSPPPEQGLVNAVVAAIAAAAALVSSALTNFIKQIPYLGNEDKDKLATAVTQIVAVLVSVVTGYVAALAAQSLGLIEDGQLRSLAVAVLTPVFAELRYRLASFAK